MTDSFIKVGMTSRQNESRLKDYNNIEDKYISGFINDIFNKEIILINFASIHLGEPIKGREYFKYDNILFHRIVEFCKNLASDSKSLTEDQNDYLTNSEYYSNFQDRLVADFSKGLLLKRDEICIKEREQMLVTVNEAIDDVNNGLCTETRALIEIKLVLETLLNTPFSKLYFPMGENR